MPGTMQASISMKIGVARKLTTVCPTTVAAAPPQLRVTISQSATAPEAVGDPVRTGSSALGVMVR